MNQALVDKIVRAVLYEGYVLYPYRPSVKNHHRWTFGGIYPKTYSEANAGADGWTMQTQCIVNGGPSAALDVTVRFLHLMARTVGRMRDSQTGAQPTFEPVEALEVGGQSYQSWQEAVEREVKLDSITLGELAANLRPTKFTLPGRSDSEPLRDQGGRTVGMLVREQQPIAGAIELSAGKKAPDVFLITARIENHIPFSDDRAKDRDAALMRALVSTHTILGVRGGQFVSLTDPAEPLRAFTADCRNVGCWPVLVGEAGEKDTMLSSPIILYDYPQIAPESSGDLFDSTEIDEILTLRIMTLTDEEKRQGAAVDERVRALLDRTEALARERLMDLHGAMRGMRPHIEEAAFRLGGTQPGAVVPQEEHHA